MATPHPGHSTVDPKGRAVNLTTLTEAAGAVLQPQGSSVPENILQPLLARQEVEAGDDPRTQGASRANRG